MKKKDGKMPKPDRTTRHITGRVRRVYWYRRGNLDEIAGKLLEKRGRKAGRTLILTSEGEDMEMGDDIVVMPASGLYFCHLMEKKKAWESDTLCLATTLAAANAVHETTGARVTTRWPNDVMLRSKKIASVFVSLHPSEDNEIFKVFGVINTNVDLKHIPANLRDRVTTLKHEGVEVENKEVERELVRQLEKILGKGEEEDIKAALEQWTDRSYTIGKFVRIYMNPQIFIEGRALMVDENGSLVIVHKDRSTGMEVFHKVKMENCYKLY